MNISVANPLGIKNAASLQAMASLGKLVKFQAMGTATLDSDTR